MGFLAGKKVLITGLLSNRSIAYGIAKACHREGAELAFTYAGDRSCDRVHAFAEEFGSNLVFKMDVSSDEEIQSAVEGIGNAWGALDGVVHSIGFAPREAIAGDFLEGLSREAFKIAMDISAYSFPALAKACLPLMEGRNGSVLTLSYLGSERVVPHLPEEPVHPFFHERNIANPKRAYIVLTADKGMAGAYNQNIIKFLKENADENDRFYVIGQTGYRALYHKDPRLVEDFHYGATEPTLQRARDITMDAIDDFKTGKLDEIYLIYTRIENALTSEPTMVRLLPLDRAHLQPAPKGLGDPKGDVEMFPSAWTVFEQIAPIYMHGMIFGAMTESFCAEQSARMTAMDSATKNANDMIRELQLEYNRTRQGSITQEITEIIGGAAAVQNRAE